MKLGMYSVFDTAAQAYMRPFFEVSRGIAVRNFLEECGKADSPLSKYPMDFHLVYLGWFDDGPGVFQTQLPERIMSASDAKVPETQISPDVADISEAGLRRFSKGFPELK